MTILIVCLSVSTLLAQASLNMAQLANWDPAGYPVYQGVQYNDIWGWVAPTGEEYAIMGGSDSILIIDVTECGSPERVYGFGGGDLTIWRDIKTYGNYAYSVCDGGNCDEGLHVFDLSDLPGGSVTHVLTTTAFFSRAHNIFIDTTTAKLYAVGVAGATDIVVLDLTNPARPSLLANVNFNTVTGTSNNYYVHDVYVKNDTAYCSHGNDETFIVWDMTDLNAIEEIGNLNTGDYNHSGWVDAENNYAYFCEEVPTGQPVGIIDLANLGDPVNDIQFVGDFIDPIESTGNPTPHNPFVRGDYLYISYYEDGTKVYDITTRDAPVLLAYYDTYPDNMGNYTGYEGNWGTYPFLPSGCIISSDITYGLHTLQVDYGLTDTCTPEVDVDDATTTTGTYIASNHLRSTTNVPDASSPVLFQANFSVTLEPGFETGTDVDFEAKIDNCSSPN